MLKKLVCASAFAAAVCIGVELIRGTKETYQEVWEDRRALWMATGICMERARRGAYQNAQDPEAAAYDDMKFEKIRIREEAMP